MIHDIIIYDVKYKQINYYIWAKKVSDSYMVTFKVLNCNLKIMENGIWYLYVDPSAHFIRKSGSIGSRRFSSVYEKFLL